MGTYTVVAQADYRNEGWTLGGGVVSLTNAWNNDDDGKYASCPSNKGRAAVRFPIDISTSNIPQGAAITSVTVKIRVRKTVADSKSVTVNVLSTDDTSRYTSRTLYPSTLFADYTVGTYTTDPLGRAWDRDRLNRLAIQVFSYSVPPNDGVRVAKLYAVINYRSRPSVQVAAPTGTVASPSPVVSWVYSQEDGDLQKSAEYKVFTAAQVGDPAFNPDTVTATYAGTVTGDITSLTLPTALGPNTYYMYVRATSLFGSVSPWNSRAFTVQGAAPGVPGGGVGGIGAGGGGGFERAIADPEMSNAYLTLRDGSNLLSVQQASFETADDALGYIPENATLAYDNTAFYQGVASMKMTAAAGGDMTATTNYFEVAPNEAVTARAQVKAATTGRTVWLHILFYDQEFTYLGAHTASASVTDSSSTWTEIVTTGTSAPGDDTPVYAQVQIQVVGAAASEVHNVDQVGLMYGTNSRWSHGGHASRNILSSAQSTADGTITDEPWTAYNAASSLDRTSSAGIGVDGPQMFRMTYTGVTPSISYVAAGTVFSTTSTQTGFTLNKPAGVADGDVLVAYVAAMSGGSTYGDGLFEAPAGWTMVDRSVVGGWGNVVLWVLMRDGLAADPSTWVGNLPSSATRIRAVVHAYRGAAPTAEQFTAKAGAWSISGSTTMQTASVANSDANAWRLSAFALRDDTGPGSMTANKQPAAAAQPIRYVGRGANWWYGGALGSYQINKPSGVQANDVMLAFGAFSGTATANAPVGWTEVRRTVRSNGNGDDHSGTLTFIVWLRVATGSEPSSWTSNYWGSGTPLMTQAVAYRNVDTSSPLISEGVGSANGNVVYHPGVTNTVSGAWRVQAYSFTTNYGAGTGSNEAVERSDNATDVGAHPDVQIGVYDSNGGVSTGTHTGYYGYVTGFLNSWAGIGWMTFLRPAPPVAPGTNESERHDGGTFTGSYGLHLGNYDSGGVAGTNWPTVYGTYSPSSGSSIVSSVSWIGYLAPAGAVTTGEVAAGLATPVDISAVPSAVLDRSGGKVTVLASFLGSTSGQPYLHLHCYNGNELVSVRTAPGRAFNTGTWVQSEAVFELPAGTTRVACAVSATDREVGDEVYFDRISVGFGESRVWRPGTGRAEHPVFSVPVIEYAEDTGTGYGEWLPLFGSERALLSYDQLTGLVTYVDQTLTPLASRKYRAKTVSYGLAGDLFASNYGAESDEISLVAEEWWIKDLSDPGAALRIKVRSEEFGTTTASTAAVFQPLGADLPVVLTEGYKGDSFTITAICERESDRYATYAQIRALLNSGKTLFIQTNLDSAWWVRPIGDIGGEVQETYRRHENPVRFVELTFTEVDPLD